MKVDLRFELIAVYPDADLHSQFCIISECAIAERLKANIELVSGLVLPDRFIARVRMEDGTPVCILVDKFGISIMDEPAVHWFGNTEIVAPGNTVIFFHYVG